MSPVKRGDRVLITGPNPHNRPTRGTVMGSTDGERDGERWVAFVVAYDGFDRVEEDPELTALGLPTLPPTVDTDGYDWIPGRNLTLIEVKP